MTRPRHRDVSPEQFDMLVHQALAELPAPYARLAQEVSVVVEDEPPPDILEDLELDSADDLLGLYQGLPVVAESFSYWRPAASAHRHLSRTDLTALRNR